MGADETANKSPLLISITTADALKPISLSWTKFCNFVSIVKVISAPFKCPTLSILATDDKMCPVKEGKKLASLIDGSQVDIIDNCGHMMLLEEADRVLTVLKKFITTNYPPLSS